MQDDEVRRIVQVALAEQKRSSKDETVSLTLKSFGIDEEDRVELKADLAHLRRWRKALEQMERSIGRAVVSAVVTGLIGLVILGVKAKFFDR